MTPFNPMPSQIRTIAAYTLLESLRNRLLWLVLLAAVAAIGLSGFLNELALTEKTEMQLAIMAAFLRMAAVFLIASFVISSMLREAHDKGVELLLALALPRSAYVLGKLAGYIMLATLIAILFGLLTAFLAPVQQSALWTLSLMFECWIVVAFAVLCVISLAQMVPSLCAVAGFYLLARSISILQIIGDQNVGEATASQQIISTMVHGLATVLPHFDAFTRSDWLLYGLGSWHQLALLAGQSVIYLGLLTAATLFDLYRTNI